MEENFISVTTETPPQMSALPQAVNHHGHNPGGVFCTVAQNFPLTRHMTMCLENSISK